MEYACHVSISYGSKVIAKVEVDKRHRQTNKQTDRQEKNNLPPIIRSGVHNKNRGTRLHKLWETDIHIIRLHVQMYQQTGMCKAHRKGGIQIRIQEAPSSKRDM